MSIAFYHFIIFLGQNGFFLQDGEGKNVDGAETIAWLFGFPDNLFC